MQIQAVFKMPSITAPTERHYHECFFCFFLNVGPPQEDIFSGHLLSPVFQSSLVCTDVRLNIGMLRHSLATLEGE